MSTINDVLGKQKYIKADLIIKAKEIGIKGYSKMTKDKLIESILSENNKPQTEKLKQQVLKKTIPKTLKNNVWDLYIGKEKGIGECFTCHKEIDSKHFECGHVIADSDGGDITIENLRPVCSLCNKSMGTMNMNIFKDKLAKSSKIVILSQFLNKYKFVSNQPNLSNQQNLSYLSNLSNQPNLSYLSNLSNLSTKSEIKIENYDNVLFESIEKLWCNIDIITEFVTLYQKDKTNTSILESINYITEYVPCNNLSCWIPDNGIHKYLQNTHPDQSYKEINKDKLIRWLYDNEINVVDITYKKIEVKFEKNKKLEKFDDNLVFRYCKNLEKFY